MSVFRNYEAALANRDRVRDELVSAGIQLEKAEAPLAAFRTKGLQSVETVLNSLSKAKLLPGIDLQESKDWLQLEGIMGAKHIILRSHKSGGTVLDDTNAITICNDIISAAQADNVPVKLAQNGGNFIRVSDHIKESEKAPGILLKALGAFAESKGRSDIAAQAKQAAGELAEMVKQLGQERPR